MTNQDLISAVEEICAHRLTSAARLSGKWITWDCGHSGQTMSKFIDRVKRNTRQPAFFRNGTFGVLAAE